MIYELNWIECGL